MKEIEIKKIEDKFNGFNSVITDINQRYDHVNKQLNCNTSKYGLSGGFTADFHPPGSY